MIWVDYITESRDHNIIFGYLGKIGFTYYYKLIKIILIKRKKIITYTKQDQNLFMLNFIKPNKPIAIDHKKSIYIISKNKYI